MSTYMFNKNEGAWAGRNPYNRTQNNGNGFASSSASSSGVVAPGTFFPPANNNGNNINNNMNMAAVAVASGSSGSGSSNSPKINLSSSIGSNTINTNSNTSSGAGFIAGRKSYPYINSQIISAAESGHFDHLMATIGMYAEQMNLVNISTALHRLAKLATGSAEAPTKNLLQNPSFGLLLEAARRQLQENGSLQPQGQALSNIVWSLATLEVVDLQLLAQVAGLAQLSIGDFKPFELASLHWAFSKLAELDPRVWESAIPLFEATAISLSGRLNLFTFRCLVMLVTAYAAMPQNRGADFITLAMGLMIPLPRVAGCHELANLATCLAKVEVRQETALQEIAYKAALRLHEMRSGEIVDVFVALTKLNFFHKRFVDRALHAATHMEMTPSQLCQLLSAALSLRPRRSAVRSAALRLLPRATEHVGELNAQELSLLSSQVYDFLKGSDKSDSEETLSETLLSQATAFQAAVEKEWPGVWPQSYSSQSTSGGDSDRQETRSDTDDDSNSSEPAVVVKNTFVHIEDTSFAEKQEMVLELLGKPLPAPLAVLPSSLCPNDLEQFRMDYQIFRAGKPFGAKGELSRRPMV